ncbi:peptidoglycan-recognition protein LB [Amyelois transitella]|uniref:peptidoglycan-recognition protein LB n=1 Tax=Amyelois transitella TaxID=680683 RepID=UPI0029907B96|nr:peptidoglycan-recognition protein LB [Amyelois transitella]
MTRFILHVLALAVILTSATAKSLNCYPFSFVDRNQWGAEPAKGQTALGAPVQFVVIHHSYQPGVCLTRQECITAMRSMQSFHQNDQGWVDIGYNFAVGGEGSVYEGRGWENVGAHAVGYNAQSIGICIIGDWINVLPPREALEATKQLIQIGVSLGYISPNYVLMGHRQASDTECPGSALFNEISTWDQFRRD